MNTRILEQNEKIPNNWYRVDTIDFQTLQKSTGLSFNVLVCDCEGCLFNILKDEPSFLDQFNKVLLENDFWGHPEEEQFVHDRLRELGFTIVYQRELNHHYPSFWQTWMRPKA